MEFSEVIVTSSFPTIFDGKKYFLSFLLAPWYILRGISVHIFNPSSILRAIFFSLDRFIYSRRFSNTASDLEKKISEFDDVNRRRVSEVRVTGFISDNV